MNSFTKEQLIEHAQDYIAHDSWLKEKFGENHKTPATVELARIALVSLEASQPTQLPDDFVIEEARIFREDLVKKHVNKTLNSEKMKKERLLSIIEDHNLAHYQQLYKYIYLAIALAVLLIASLVIITIYKSIIPYVTFFISLVSFSYLICYVYPREMICPSDGVFSLMERAKNYPEVRKAVIELLLSGSKITGKDVADINHLLKEACKLRTVQNYDT